MNTPQKKARLATVWLDGCSGCHMSFLDIDERLVALAGLADLVYSPLVDFKEYPENVDVALIEGAVSSEHDLERIKKVRSRTRILVAMGDCAVTTNVPGMRNYFGPEAIMKCGYSKSAALNPGTPSDVVPRLLERVRPVHEVVKVDVFIPGCPPSADTLFYALTELLAGRIPELNSLTRFGK